MGPVGFPRADDHVGGQADSPAATARDHDDGPAVRAGARGSRCARAASTAGWMLTSSIRSSFARPRASVPCGSRRRPIAPPVRGRGRSVRSNDGGTVFGPQIGRKAVSAGAAAFLPTPPTAATRMTKFGVLIRENGRCPIGFGVRTPKPLSAGRSVIDPPTAAEKASGITVGARADSRPGNAHPSTANQTVRIRTAEP